MEQNEIDLKKVNKNVSTAKRLWKQEQRVITYDDEISKAENALFVDDVELSNLVEKRTEVENQIKEYVSATLSEHRATLPKTHAPKVFFVQLKEGACCGFDNVIYISLNVEKAKEFAIKYYEEHKCEVYLSECYLDDDLSNQEEVFMTTNFIHNLCKGPECED